MIAEKSSASKSVRCAQYVNLKLKRTRNSALALSCLRFITGVCKSLQYYKVKYGMAPRYVSELFTIKSPHQRLRNCDFELPRFDTVAYGRHSLRYQGPFIWSKVSSELRNLASHSRNIYAVWTFRAI